MNWATPLLQSAQEEPSIHLCNHTQLLPRTRCLFEQPPTHYYNATRKRKGAKLCKTCRNNCLFCSNVHVLLPSLLASPPTCFFQHLWWCLPWLMNVVCWQLTQNWQPSPDIVSIRIKALPLLLQVNHVAERMSI